MTELPPSIQNKNCIYTEIISKGYNLEEFINYNERTRGVDFFLIPLDSLRKIIENFKNEKNNKSNSSNIYKIENENPNTVEGTPDNLIDIPNAPCTYEILCTEQAENPLKALEKKGDRIKITVSLPERIITTFAFFSKETFVYPISCTHLNANTKRTFQDIEWLRTKFSEHYPYILLPPLVKDMDISPLANIRYINRFFEVICRKKILRTSPILAFFLLKSNSDFNKIKEIKPQKLILLRNLSNYITYTGKMSLELTNVKAKNTSHLQKFVTPSIQLYEKLNASINELCKDFLSASRHLREMGEIFAQFEEEAKKTLQRDKIKKLFAHLTKIFKECAEGYIKTSEIYGNDVREHFDYIKRELSEISVISKVLKENILTYEAFVNKLIVKKESLFKEKNFNKWDIEPNSKPDYEKLINNKEAAFKVMCFRETRECEDIKKHLVLIISELDQQYKKLLKYQEERTENLIKSFTEKYSQQLTKDFNLIRLFIPQF